MDGDEVWAALRAAARDRSSGSARIAARAAEAVAALDDPADVPRALRVLLKGQPFMAACVRLADEVLHASDPRAAASSFARRLEREARSSPAALRLLLPRGGVVLTVSASSAVVRALTGLGPRSRPRVLCAVSEPGGEGRAAAAELRAAGVEADVLPDAAVAGAAASSDLVVFGADAVGPDALLNKTGTAAAVLGAMQARRDRVCVAATSKFVDAAMWTRLAEAAATRSAAVRGTDAVALFEVVPLRWVTSVLTEDGPLQARTAGRLAASSHLDARTIAAYDDATSA
jgi:translation initiation factor 2B subunit (eIF-2B alpha/beta/delta family)